MTNPVSSLTAVVVVAITAVALGSRPPDPAELHAEAVAAHLSRDLGAASALYDEALEAEPPRHATASELAFVRQVAPRIFSTATEPFALEDVAAIVHPVSGIIAYHLFWDDDIDFPDDNDPSDHEVVWIRAGRQSGDVSDVWTYFHGRILHHRSSGVQKAHRPRVEVQWGKHGSLPPDWRRMTIVPEEHEVADGIPQSTGSISLARYLEGSFQKLRHEGRRLQDHPIAARLGWPERFDGSRDSFIKFDKEVELATRLDHRNVLVSRFNSGPLNRWIVPYNFRPKTEWPPDDPAVR